VNGKTGFALGEYAASNMLDDIEARRCMVNWKYFMHRLQQVIAFGLRVPVPLGIGHGAGHKRQYQ
jgi:hypothetical protein